MATGTKTNDQNWLESLNSKAIMYITIGSLLFYVIIRIIGLLLQYHFVGENWPLWMTILVPTINEVVFSVILVISAAIFFTLISKNNAAQYKSIIIGGMLLIIGSNLIHGWTEGIYSSIAGIMTDNLTGTELYSDAVQITNIFSFLEDYQSIQLSLGVHSTTHPPGAVITIYLFNLVFQSPDLIAIAICVISTLLTSYFFNNILRTHFEVETSNYVTLLLLVIPAIQIYFLANIYALVVSFILGTVYFYMHKDKKKSFLGSIICLFLASFLSFMSVFVVVFLFLYETFDKKDIRALEKLFDICLVTFLIYLILFITLGFNYIETFINASISENPDGFMLLSDPINYVFTRIQNVFDILIFYGPILTVLSYQGLKILREKEDQTLFLFTIIAISTLLLLFSLGVYKKGETARAAIYIYPFLLIPVATFLEQVKKNTTNSGLTKVLILIAVFCQTIVMQLFGNYIW
ncbi:MAG: hypothetical protein ACFFFH_11165 [Candidatus Thorarchaeota archaeon]